MEEGWRDGRQEAGLWGAWWGGRGEGLRRAPAGAARLPAAGLGAPTVVAGRGRPGRHRPSARLPQERGPLALAGWDWAGLGEGSAEERVS